jgi:ABC-type branched-subunit amino acid transport system substrate-binding protein
MRRTIITLLAIVFVFSLNFAHPIENAVAAEPIKIGAILNYTGPAAMLGPLFKNGIVMAIEEHNNQIAGRPIELIVEDAAGDPNICLEKARKLVERDKVKIIIGPLMGDAQLAVAPYAARKKVLITTLYCGGIDLVEHGNYLIYPSTTVSLTIPVGLYARDMG